MKNLTKYSIGVGDRFAHQGKAQLQAIIEAKKLGIEITPVWNKSNREHKITGSKPEDTRKEADETVKFMQWKGSYFVDADHINLSNVDDFIPSSDFFTIDVVEYIGKHPKKELIQSFLDYNRSLVGKLWIEGIPKPFEISIEFLKSFTSKFLYAIQQAVQIYKHIKSIKGINSFITEISMDEVDIPQTPLELFFIIKTLSEYNIPINTVAPKFPGQFNKGIDYVGDISKFTKEFTEYIFVVKYAVDNFELPENLKLSIHSGSDKFKLYPIINKLIIKYNQGIHIKTAGTTWLQELKGIAMAGNDGLNLAKEIYVLAFNRYDEMVVPYSTVIDIDLNKLPPVKSVLEWSSEEFERNIDHNQEDPLYNLHFRQFMHISYKVAAEMKDNFYSLLNKYSSIIEEEVTDNILHKHIIPLFKD